MAAEELSGDDARATLRRTGLRRLGRDTFRRFRYGDGFTSARALGYQFVLGFIPLVIATVALSSTMKAEKPAQALRDTLLTLNPGGSSDAVGRTLRNAAAQGSGDQLVFVVGLVTAAVALVASMGQIERGANRIYGVERDRSTLPKYLRATVLGLVAGIPAMIGFLLLVAGGTAIDVFSRAYGWSDTVTSALQVARWPLGALLGLLAITVIFRWAPRRRQPAMSWMAFGAGGALVLWLGFTGLLALYINSSPSFGRVYGALTGVFALLLWAQLTATAQLLGIAAAAQLEAIRSGQPQPVMPDPERAARPRPGSAVDAGVGSGVGSGVG
jgi:YihY family inner membrane protein